jgi:demethylmenaquinone methyltransferase/2-methoxy-6-polyprenyl-1,4-benzoquinol methylase
MGRVLSLGQDPRWRRFLVSRATTPRGARALDVAAGTGLVSRALARAGRDRVVALDQSEAMIGEGRRRIPGGDGAAVSFVVGEADRLPFRDGSFDAVTFTYLLRYVDDPGATLRELSRVLRDGGVLANLEFFVPDDSLARAAWRAYTYGVMPLIASLASREWGRTGRFLGPSIERFYRRWPLARQRELWRGAGIDDLEVRRMSLGGGVVIWGTRNGG